MKRNNFLTAAQAIERSSTSRVTKNKVATKLDQYALSQDSRHGFVDVNSALMQYMYTGQEGSSIPENALINASDALNPSVNTPVPVLSTNHKGYIENYFLLDTFNQGTNKLSVVEGQISFDLTQYNNMTPITNIVAITIEPFYFPSKYAPDNMPGYFYSRKVYMTINSFPSGQGLNGFAGQTFHYSFDVSDITSLAVKLTPTREQFILHNMLSTCNIFTITFYLPPLYQPIRIPKDVITVILINGTFPAQFEIIGTTTEDIFVNPYQLGTITYPFETDDESRYAIQFHSLLSANIIPDVNIRNTIFNPIGFFVKTIISPTRFIVDNLDLSTITDLIIYQLTMYVPKNRISFATRFTCSSNKIGIHRTYE